MLSIVHATTVLSRLLAYLVFFSSRTLVNKQPDDVGSKVSYLVTWSIHLDRFSFNPWHPVNDYAILNCFIKKQRRNVQKERSCSHINNARTSTVCNQRKTICLWPRGGFAQSHRRGLHYEQYSGCIWVFQTKNMFVL